MFFSRVSCSFLTIAAFSQIVVASASIESAGIEARDLSRSNSAKLTAVTVRSPLQKREGAFRPSQHCEHHYADHSAASQGSKARIAKTSMKYKLPALALEDIEMSLESIQCSESAIVIEFSERETLDVAREAWGHLQSFLVISSHPGCNEDGGRAPYLVSGTTFDEETSKTTFTAQRIQWKGAYESMTVKFGHSSDAYNADAFRFHSSLRRGESSSSTALVARNGVANITSHKDIGFEIPADQQIFSMDGVTFSCKSCFMTGTVDIVEGEFTISNSTTEAGKILDFIHTGYFKTVVNNMTAHVELDTSLSASTTHDFSATLISLGLPGFTIPDIATIGPMFRPTIVGSIQVVSTIDFTYGFDLKVPDNSTIVMNVGDLAASTSSGFNQSKITALPLAASSPEMSVILGLGLRPELALGVDILASSGLLTAGIFLDLPMLQVNITTFTGVNDKCQPVTNFSAQGLPGLISSNSFPKLTEITPSIAIDVGLEVEAEVDIIGANINTKIGASTTLVGTTFTLPTSCLSFDSNKKIFVAPTVSATTTTSGIKVEATETGTSVGNGNGSTVKSLNAGGKTRENPLAGRKGIWWTGGMLSSVLLVALTL